MQGVLKCEMRLEVGILFFLTHPMNSGRKLGSVSCCPIKLEKRVQVFSLFMSLKTLEPEL